MNVFSTIDEIRMHRWKEALETWGLVPTMGFLHEGHLSLVRRARQENEKVGVSIFINPIQFSNPDDLSAYPRDLDRDFALLEEEGVDLIWTPTPDIMYSRDYQTYVDVEEVSKPLEGASRTGHFRGVTTVVAKLINMLDGRVLATKAQLNPQIRYGDDVISRISYAQTEEKLKQLQGGIVKCINKLLYELCKKTNVKPEDIYEISAVGNTTMNHLFLKLNPKYLALNPYVGVLR